MAKVLSHPLTAFAATLVLSGLGAVGLTANVYFGIALFILAALILALGIGESWRSRATSGPEAASSAAQTLNQSPISNGSAVAQSGTGPSMANSGASAVQVYGDVYGDVVTHPPRWGKRAAPKLEITDTSERDTRSDGNMWRLLILNMGDPEWFTAKACIVEPNWYTVPWRPANNRIAEKRLLKDETDILDVARVARMVSIWIPGDDAANERMRRIEEANKRELDMFSVDVGTFDHSSKEGWPVSARLRVSSREDRVWEGTIELEYDATIKDIGDLLIEGNQLLEIYGRPRSPGQPSDLVASGVPKQFDWSLKVQKVFERDAQEFVPTFFNDGPIYENTAVKPASIQQVEGRLKRLDDIIRELRTRL